ncbi:MAG: LysR substrate-binding domain-containing protein [Hyphomicrobiaceae bacterium]
MPNLRQLEYLVAIADTLHFKRAAERCNTTQPTLSEQFKALEERLGVQLVERSRSRVVVTPLGHQVVEIARRMLSDANEIRMLATSGGRELAGLLRLGLPPTIGPYLLPHVLPALHKSYPKLKLYIRESLPEELPRALEDGRLDVIITLLPVTGSEFDAVPLFREPLLLTVASDHPLAGAKTVRKEDLKGEDMLALGPGHQLHEAVLSLCTEFGARLRYDFEGTSLDTLREMVVMGMGITFLPGLYARREIDSDPSLTTLQIEGRTIYRTVGMVWRKTSARQDDYAKLAEFFRSAGGESFANTAVPI